METLSVTEAAAYLGVSYNTLRNMLKDGRLRATPGLVDKREKRVSKVALDRLKAGLPAYEDQETNTNQIAA